jgi:hypothetical protein
MMAGRFAGFVIFAGMRTGSNLLEAALNSVPGVTCHGEAFNGAFLGWPRKDSLLGVTREERDGDPAALLDRIRKAGGMNGFRYFDDHDPRVFDLVARDPSWAKVVLSRNPLDSYISLKIARRTGQWKLGDLKGRREGLATFDAAEFETFLGQAQDFRLRLQTALQTTGQTAFWLDYEDLRDPAVLNGLLAHLGVAGRIEALPGDLVPQNPDPPERKVTNPAGMAAGLGRIDAFGSGRTAAFETRRGPSVPGYIALRQGGLLFQPVRSGPTEAVRAWLGAFGPLVEGMTQKDLRQWLRQSPGRRVFTVLRHPLARAHAAFRDTILSGRYAEIRDTLVSVYRLPIEDAMDAAGHRAAFLAFLEWLKGNLNGQTSVRVDGAWASQWATLAGHAQVLLPDAILRGESLAEDLDHLARRTGLGAPPQGCATESDPLLAEIYDPLLEKAARDAYARDYAAFGFGDWQPRG